MKKKGGCLKIAGIVFIGIIGTLFLLGRSSNNTNEVNPSVSSNDTASVVNEAPQETDSETESDEDLIEFDTPPTVTPVPEGGECPNVGISFYGVGQEAKILTGEEFYLEAREYEGKNVEIVASVIESAYFQNDYIDGTLLLVTFYGKEPLYLGVVYLPDQGIGVENYLPGFNIGATGTHNGYDTVPENIFEFYPNVGEEYDLPLLTADKSFIFCKAPTQ